MSRQMTSYYCKSNSLGLFSNYFLSRERRISSPVKDRVICVMSSCSTNAHKYFSSLTLHNDHIQKISSTDAWFRNIVIGQKLCPFAPPLTKKKSLIRICSSNASSIQDIVKDIKAEAQYIKNLPKEVENVSSWKTFPKPEARPETTLVVFDNDNEIVSNYSNFVRVSWEVQQKAIYDQGLADDLQLVVFHPNGIHSTYSDYSDENLGEDAGDYTIRSPFPTLHILREMDVLNAVKSYSVDRLQNLLVQNKERLRSHGIAKCRFRLKQCYE